MILTADYHTHTKFSHGKGTVLENAEVAEQKGLKELGISDHGFAHPAFGLRKRKLEKLTCDTQMASELCAVKVLRGIESNIISVSGKTDLKSSLYDNFDIFLAGVHKLVIYRLGSYCKFSLPNLFLSQFKVKNVPKWLIKENTKAFINVIKNNPVDIITHLNFCCYADAVEVAKVAADYGTYIELNAKKTHLTKDELYEVEKTGVNFIISSDAHTPDRVGEISLVENLLKEVNIDSERIMNIDGKLPDFRFRAYKDKY